MAYPSYPSHDGTTLAPQVFVDPATGEALPILVKDISAGSASLPPDPATPNALRTTGSGTVTASALQVTVANVGTASGTVLGVAIKANEVFSWESASGLTAVPYDATGTEFVVIWTEGA